MRARVLISTFIIFCLPAEVAGQTTDTTPSKGQFVYHEYKNRPSSRVAPVWPSECDKPKERQQVIVEFDVDENGYTENIKIISSMDECFNQAAIEAIQKWRYEPFERNGKLLPRKNMRQTFYFINSDE